MSNNKRARTIVVAVILSTLVIAALSYLKSKSAGTVADDRVKTESSEPPLLDSHDDLPDGDSQIEAPKKINNFLKVMKSCFPETPDTVQTTAQFIQNWKSFYPQAAETTDFIHYFFKDSGGKEMRAQILYTYINGRPIREFRLYQILGDGLPDPVKLNKQDKHNPSDTTLAKYIDYSTVFETQKKWLLKGSSTSYIEVEESNSEILEFQLFQDKRTLRCHIEECSCLK